jgi:hypothetical protein
MTSRCLPLMTAAALAAAMVPALAQPAAPAAPSASAAASAPAKPPPRVQTPTELRERATVPGDVRPEERVTPQIVVPLRKTGPPPTKTERAAARRGDPSASGAIDDAAAKCEAQASDAARRACRAGLAQKKATPKTP